MHQRSLARSAAAALALALLLGSTAASAYNPRGHEVIEAAAYRELMARPRVEQAGASGREILAFLIRHGVLARPRCFEAAPDDDRCGAEARRERAIDFWPILGSGSPDLLESRQLTSRGQCYHFLADADDGRGRRDAGGIPVGLARAPYARCIRLFTSLYDEILRDPYAAFIRGRGTYILLHALADSFSRAHAVRAGEDGTGKVRYLKYWILRSWLLYLFDARHFDARFQHELVDRRDNDYLRRADDRCDDAVVPYEVPVDCLTPAAAAARDTLIDALVTVYVVLRHRDDGRPAAESKGAALPLDLDGESTAVARAAISVDDPFAREAWRRFLEAHLASTQAPLVVAKQRPDEREWQPNVLVAGAVRKELDGGGWDASVTFGVMQVVRRALPLLPLETVSLGYGRHAGDGHLLLRADLSFLVPIWDHLGIGAAPLGGAVDCVHDFSSCDVALTSLPVRASFVADSGLWVDVTGPEYDWTAHAWRNRLGLGVGGAFDLLRKLKPGTLRRSRERRGEWAPPPLIEGQLLREPPIAHGFFFEGDVGGSRDDRLLGLGLEGRRERDPHGRRAGLGYGATLAYQGGRLGGRRVDDARFAPHVTWFLVPGTLAVRVAPASLAVGRRGEDAYVDVGLAAQLSLSVSALELSLAAPRVSYVHPGDNHWLPITLRVSWRLRD